MYTTPFPIQSRQRRDSQGQGNQGIMRPVGFGREQIIPQIDAEIAEKGHFWMETT